MSAFGNLFSAESNNQTNTTNYADSFKTTDSNNVSINTSPNLKDVLTTTLNINAPSDFAKVAPWLALGIIGAILLIAIWRGK